jgi:hypothetical protein
MRLSRFSRLAVGACAPLTPAGIFTGRIALILGGGGRRAGLFVLGNSRKKSREPKLAGSDLTPGRRGLLSAKTS